MDVGRFGEAKEGGREVGDERDGRFGGCWRFGERAFAFRRGGRDGRIQEEEQGRASMATSRIARWS